MEYGIQERTLDFAIDISKYYLDLKNKRHYEVASQLFRSGTSIGANIAKHNQDVAKRILYIKGI